MDLLQLWGLVRRHWLVLLASLVVGLGAGAGVSMLQPTLYSATSTGYVVAGSSETVGDAFAASTLAAQKAETYLPLVKSRVVAERVAKEVGLESVADVADSLKGTNNGVIFSITATAPTAQLAAAMADAAIRATSAEANALETLTISGKTSGKTVVQIVPVEQAKTPTTPASPNWKRNLALGTAIGLLLGFGLVLLKDLMDRKVRQASTAEAVTGVSALGVILKDAEVAGSTNLAGNLGPAAESLRELRTNLRFVSVDDPVKSIVVTSSLPGEGKSTVAAHLASMLADSGETTVLIDADLRRPTQATRFGVEQQVGLTQLLAGSVKINDALVKTGQPKLFLLPAGRIPPNPSELVGSRRMQQLISTLSQTMKVVIDAPPLLPVSDAGLLTTAADGALVVVQAGKTRTEQLGHAAKKLEQVNGKLLGVVLNMVKRKDLGSTIYGYGYSSSSDATYYYTSKPERAAKTDESGDHGHQQSKPRRAKFLAPAPAEPHHAVEEIDPKVSQ